jgi:tetratricopeptide (TPR) repeat protein
MRGAIAALGLCVALVPARASADPSQEARKEKARALFATGSAFAAKSRWKDALEAFEQSGALVDHASIHYNVGFCERALGHSTRALKSLRTALRRDAAHGKQELSPRDHESALQLAGEVDAQLARLDLVLRRAGLSIAIDGRPLERDTVSGEWIAGTRASGPNEPLPERAVTVLVDPGAHAVSVSDASGRSRSYDVTVAERARQELTVDAPRAGAPFWSTRRISALAVGGAALGALAFGIGFTAKAAANKAAAEEACPGGQVCPDDRAHDLSIDAVRAANFATAGFVVAGAAAAAALTLWLTAPKTTPAKVGLAAGSVHLEVAW